MPYVFDREERHDRESREIASDHQPAAIGPVRERTAHQTDDRKGKYLKRVRDAGREGRSGEMEDQQRNGKGPQAIAKIAEALAAEIIREAAFGEYGTVDGHPGQRALRILECGAILVEHFEFTGVG